MVVCREEGQIEKSEEITRKCFQFYVYLALHVINQKNFSFDTTQAVKSQHEPLIQAFQTMVRSEEHTSELQSRGHLVCRLLLEKKKKKKQEWGRRELVEATKKPMSI